MKRLVFGAVMVSLVLSVAWSSGGLPRTARAQSLPSTPTLVASPSQGPVGTVVSLSALGFGYFATFSSADISWDGAPFGSTSFVICSNQPVGSGQYAGFGTDCGSSAVFVTIPSSATPGKHTITVSHPANSESSPEAASITFDVTGTSAGPTATPTATVPNTPTSTPGLIISTLTATPRVRVTATRVRATPTKTATPRPRPTATSTRIGGVSNPLGEAAKLIDGHLEQAWTSTHPVGGFATVAFEGVALYRLTGAVIDPGTSPGQDGSDLRRFRLYASTTDRSPSSFHLVFEGSCEQNNELQRFIFPEPVMAKYIQLVAVDNYGNPNNVIVAEFEAVGHPASASFHGRGRFLRSLRVGAKKTPSVGSVRKIVRGLGVAAPKDKLRSGHVRQTLYPRYALRTLKKQQAGIQFRDGTMLYLDQNTDAVLSSPTQTTVKRGMTEQKIEPGTDHSITTASATADAIGTDFVTQVQGNLTSIYVVEGAVLVHNQFGFVVVKTGEFTTVQKGSAPQQPAPYNGSQNPDPAAWSHKLPDPHLPENFALDANGGRVVGTSG